MKYQLETIPVWDAYRAGGECPLCLLQAKAERELLAFHLGSSVMAPEMRVEVNKTGFCPSHFSMLLGGDNRLGLGLMTQTHIAELRRKLAAKRPAGGGAKGIAKRIDAFEALLDEQVPACLICDRLAERFARYAFTIAYLWNDDQEFRAAFGESAGFCLSHLPGQLQLARETLSSSQLVAFATHLEEVQERAWQRLDRALLAFTGSFDYQADPAQAAAIRESVANAIQKLTGVPPPPG